MQPEKFYLWNVRIEDGDQQCFSQNLEMKQRGITRFMIKRY